MPDGAERGKEAGRGAGQRGAGQGGMEQRRARQSRAAQGTSERCRAEQGGAIRSTDGQRQTMHWPALLYARVACRWVPPSLDSTTS